MSLLITGWGVLGWIDLPQHAQAGFATNAYSTVTQVSPGSPAQLAGLRPGDRIIQFDGVAVENAAAIARQPRKKVGEIQRVTIDNEGASKVLSIAYGPMPEGQLAIAHASAIIGICFLLFPLAAYFRKAVEATRILAVMGTGLSLAFMTGPLVTDFGIRVLTVAVTSLFVMFGVAALFHFLLVFPEKRPWLDRSYAANLLYFPAFLLWALLTYRVVFTPAATDALNLLTSVMATVIIGAYLLLSLFQVLRNYSRTDVMQRKALGLNPMLLGTVVGLVPATVAQLVSAFSPQAGLPGQHYYFLTLALIPLSWARSASR